MTHDVFVSYAHNDDVPPAGIERGWVTYFVEELKTELTKKLGKRPDVWMDHLLLKNYRVDTELNDKIRSSRTIVLFMSPSYLNSDWCQQEIGNFLALNRAHNSKESVFIVAIEETSRQDWHARLQNLTPLALYQTQLNGSVRRLGSPRPPLDSEHEYWTKLNELAHLINAHLRFLNKSAPIEDTVTDKPASANTEHKNLTGNLKAPTLWIAQPTLDLHPNWEALAAAARQRGATVVPLAANVYHGELQAINADIASADILIQLLSEESDDLGKLLQLQAFLAKLSDKPFLQWRAPMADLASVVDTKHRELLQGTIACGFEQFRQQVLTQIDGLLRPQTKKLAGDGQSGQKTLQLCITAGPKDYGLIEEISRIVSDLQHAAIEIPPPPDNNQQIEDYNQDLRSLLTEVDGVILAHSVEKNFWLHTQKSRVSRLLSSRPKPWGAFIDGPPSERPLVACKDPGLMYLDCRTGLSPAPIQAFIDKLLGVQHV